MLQALDDNSVFDHDNQLGHPADIFVLTFRDAVESINKLAKAVNKSTEIAEQGQEIPEEHLSDIRSYIFDLLFYTGNFVEGCQSIIKSIFPPGDKRFAKIARNFKNNVEVYTSHASQLINKVKHQHRRPRVFTFTKNNKVIIGYYLEGIINKGLVGPDPDMHKMYRGMRTGFSLNRMIPYHLCNLYYVSSCLKSAINEYLTGDHFVHYKYQDEVFKETFLEIARIPCMLLPDEFEKPLPVVNVKGESGYSLELPGKKIILGKDLNGARISIESRVGVRDRKVAFPYFPIQN